MTLASGVVWVLSVALLLTIAIAVSLAAEARAARASLKDCQDRVRRLTSEWNGR